ncbi:MAG: hypothetical protein JSU87_00920 [Gemmatimonadota bacterium]|nr:MAG: hypothetical protein JSU87_00920 [Gemmatimonadota bacterium]
MPRGKIQSGVCRHSEIGKPEHGGRLGEPDYPYVRPVVGFQGGRGTAGLHRPGGHRCGGGWGRRVSICAGGDGGVCGFMGIIDGFESVMEMIDR